AGSRRGLRGRRGRRRVAVGRLLLLRGRLVGARDAAAVLAARRHGLGLALDVVAIVVRRTIARRRRRRGRTDDDLLVLDLVLLLEDRDGDHADVARLALL